LEVTEASITDEDAFLQANAWRFSGKGMPADPAYQSYRKFCAETKGYACPQKEFYNHLQPYGIERHRSKHGQHYYLNEEGLRRYRDYLEEPEDDVPVPTNEI
jgi:hypothetical protein